MAVPSVTSRPAAWAGTSLPILYKFLSTNYAEPQYRLLVQLFNGADVFQNEMEFTADPATGIVVANVAEMIKAVIEISAQSDLTSAAYIYTDTNWMQYYIKYQEIWTESSEALTSDSANKKHAINGGLQISQANDFADYAVNTSAKKFLTNVDRLTCVEGKFSTISAIAQNVRSRFTGSFPVPAQVTESILTGWDAAEQLTNGGMALTRQAADTLRVVGSSAGTVYVAMPFIAINSETVYLDLTFNDIAGALDFDVEVALADYNLDSVTDDSYIVSGGGNDSYTFTLTGLGSGSESIKYLIIAVTRIGGSGTYDIEIDSYPQNLLDAGTAPAFISDNASPSTIGVYRFKIPEYAESIYLFDTSTTVTRSETKSITIKESCNDVNLMWKNTLGGDACYPFSYNQVRSVKYGDGIKAKRLQCFAELLSLEQWEEIQDLNSTAETYQTPILEMLTSIIRTNKMKGQAVVEIKEDGSQVGLIAIPQNVPTDTNKNSYSTQVVVDYPQTFAQ